MPSEPALPTKQGAGGFPSGLGLVLAHADVQVFSFQEATGSSLLGVPKVFWECLARQRPPEWFQQGWDLLPWLWQLQV